MTSDVGIGTLIPNYEDITTADTAYWEATYDDGTVLSQAAGGNYAKIDRSRLSSFRLIQGGEIVFETFAAAGHGGWDLVFRRRTALVEGGGRHVTHLIGWMPDSLMEVDIVVGTWRDASELIPSLEAMPGEPDDLLTRAR